VERKAIIYQDKSYSYGDIKDMILSIEKDKSKIININGDLCPLLISKISHSILSNKIISFEKIEDNKLFDDLSGHPGLILSTSGTSGKIKLALHDMSFIMDRFKNGTAHRTISFFPYNHMAGINTIFYTLSNYGTLIIPENLTTTIICKTIEKYRAELLPTSPTFLKMLLISEEYKNYDLSSLKIISYGSEPMPEIILRRLIEILPNVKFIQTYGSTEIGVLKIKSKTKDSLYFRITNAKYRIIDSILQIKSPTSMIGYLNHSSPFTDDGWYITGDIVEADGDYIKIIGRKSELINVGGTKVNPIEVENIIHQFDNISDVTVFGEKNNILGNIVCAKIKFMTNENENDFILRLKKFLITKLDKQFIPIKITIDKTKQDGFKKRRQV